MASFYDYEAKDPDDVGRNCEDTYYGPTKSDLIFLADAEAKRASIFQTRNGTNLILYFFSLVELRNQALSPHHQQATPTSVYRSACVNLLIAELERYIENVDNSSMTIFIEASLQARYELERLLRRGSSGEDEMALALIEERIAKVSEEVSEAKISKEQALKKRREAWASPNSQYLSSSDYGDEKHDQTTYHTFQSRQQTQKENTAPQSRKRSSRVPDIILNSKRLNNQLQPTNATTYTHNSNIESFRAVEGDMIPAITSIPTIYTPSPVHSPTRMPSPAMIQPPNFLITRADSPKTLSHYRSSSTVNGSIGLRRTVSSIITPGLGLDLNFNQNASKVEIDVSNIQPAHAHARSTSNSPQIADRTRLGTPTLPFHARSPSNLSIAESIHDSPAAAKLRMPEARHALDFRSSGSNKGERASLTDSWGLPTPKRSFSAGGFHARTGSFLGVTPVEGVGSGGSSRPSSRMGTRFSTLFPAAIGSEMALALKGRAGDKDES